MRGYGSPSRSGVHVICIMFIRGSGRPSFSLLALHAVESGRRKPSGLRVSLSCCNVGHLCLNFILGAHGSVEVAAGQVDLPSQFKICTTFRPNLGNTTAARWSTAAPPTHTLCTCAMYLALATVHDGLIQGQWPCPPLSSSRSAIPLCDC